MSHILLCNDDGFQAQGITTLGRVLREKGHRVTIVAPHTERSGQSHAMSFFTPVHVKKAQESTWAVHGTPADCAAIAIMDILKEDPPDLTISGINHGYNLGWDIHYSGTVGAATEASFLGIPAMAVSMDCRGKTEAEMEKGFTITASLVESMGRKLLSLLAQAPDSTGLTWPAKSVLNINHPGRPNVPFEITRCKGDSIFQAGLQKFVLDSATDPGSDRVYILGGNSFKDATGTPPGGHDDVSLAHEGKASMTLLHFRQGHAAGEELLARLWSES